MIDDIPLADHNSEDICLPRRVACTVQALEAADVIAAFNGSKVFVWTEGFEEYGFMADLVIFLEHEPNRSTGNLSMSQLC